MFKKIVFVLLVCLVSYLLFVNKEKTTLVEVQQEFKENPLILKLLETASSYEGTKYRFGGTTVAGMDCSGLVFTSYKKINISLPRTSKNMFGEGEEVKLEEVKKGDLLFFDIDKFEGKVNHVGMVTSNEKGEIYFIHSTTEKGVIITSIKESYWEKAFIGAKRILI